MTTTKKAVSAFAVTLGMVAAMLGLATGTAQAATYGGQCGSGYSVIDSHNLGNYGTVFLTWSNAAGKNCVVTIRNGSGGQLWMNALVSLAGEPWIDDPGYWYEYAGPVFVSARNRCIDWGGVAGPVSYYEYNVHCG